MKTWVKNYREIEDWEWYKTENMAHIWQHIIRKANHEDKFWQGKLVKRGQFITGRVELSRQTGISEQQIRTCLNRLKSTNEITIEATNKFTIITICKYDEYQCQNGEIQDESTSTLTSRSTSHPTNNQPAINQQSTTNKNIRIKERDSNIDITWKTDFEKYKEDCKAAFDKFSTDQSFLIEQSSYYPKLDVVKTMWNSYRSFWGEESGWKYFKKARTKTINWELTIVKAIKFKSNWIYLDDRKQQSDTGEKKVFSLNKP